MDCFKERALDILVAVVLQSAAVAKRCVAKRAREGKKGEGRMCRECWLCCHALLSYLQFFQDHMQMQKFLKREPATRIQIPVVTLEAGYKDPLSAPLVFLAPWVFRDTIIIRVRIVRIVRIVHDVWNLYADAVGISHVDVAGPFL